MPATEACPPVGGPLPNTEKRRLTQWEIPCTLRKHRIVFENRRGGLHRVDWNHSGSTAMTTDHWA